MTGHPPFCIRRGARGKPEGLSSSPAVAHRTFGLPPPWETDVCVWLIRKFQRKAEEGDSVLSKTTSWRKKTLKTVTESNRRNYIRHSAGGAVSSSFPCMQSSVPRVTLVSSFLHMCHLQGSSSSTLATMTQHYMARLEYLPY